MSTASPTPDAAAADRPPLWRAWLLAARPRTLPVAVAPVALGTAVAAGEGGARAGPAAAALAGALPLPVASNLAPDPFEPATGADTHERIGPARARQKGRNPARALGSAIAGRLTVAPGRRSRCCRRAAAHRSCSRA